MADTAFGTGYDYQAGENNLFMGHDPMAEASTKRNMTDENQTGAEVFYKPFLYIGADDVTSHTIIRNSIDGRERAVITIEVMSRILSDYISQADKTGYNSSPTLVNSPHTWINYVPNLTGCYLVSENGKSFIQDNTVASVRSPEGVIPERIHYIVSHIVEKTGDASNPQKVKHYLELDNVPFSSTTPDWGTVIDNSKQVYRVMRVSENCFYDFTPTTIDLFKMSKRYSKMPYEDKCFTNVRAFNVYTYGL